MTNKKKRSFFDSRIFWAVVSLLASLFIWGYVTGTQEEPTKITYPGVEVQLLGEDDLQASKGYVVTDLDTTSVTVTLEGTRSNIGSLGAKDIKAVIDLSKVTGTGNNRVSYSLQYPDSVDASAVTVISKSPESISFYVANTSSKSVEVRGAFVGSVADGYIVGQPVFEPDSITISGPDNQLSNISYVWATIGGDNVSKTKTADVQFTLMDADNQMLDYTGLEYDYDTVKVTLPVYMKKEVPLDVTLVDGAGATSSNCVVTIVPAKVTISGDATIVSGINKIVLGTIDLTDFTSTFEKTYPIVLDNDVQNVTGVTSATVRVEIKGLETQKFTTTNISFINLPEAYSAEIETKSLQVTVRADPDVLDRIEADNIRAVVDLTDIATMGDVSVNADILIAGFTNAGAIGDYPVVVSIK